MRWNNWKVKRDLAVYNEDIWEHLWQLEFVFRYLRTLNVLLFYTLPYLMTVKLCGLWDSFIKHAYKQLHLLKQVYFTIPLDWLTTTLKYIKLSYASIRFPNSIWFNCSLCLIMTVVWEKEILVFLLTVQDK